MMEYKKGLSYLSFWEIFNDLCNSKGTKPNPVGKKIGVASSTITQWKNGSIPNGETLIKLADYLDCSVDYLLGRTSSSNLKLTINEKNSSPELSEDEQKMIDIFKCLTPMQQGEIIGRAQHMSEQNEELHTQKDVG